ARPGFGCRAKLGDRVLSLSYAFSEPGRGDVVAFRTPPLAAQRCGAGGVFVSRIVGLPGERIEERRGRVFVDGQRLAEPYVAVSCATCLVSRRATRCACTSA